MESRGFGGFKTTCRREQSGAVRRGKQHEGILTAGAAKKRRRRRKIRSEKAEGSPNHSEGMGRERRGRERRGRVEK